MSRGEPIRRSGQCPRLHESCDAARSGTRRGVIPFFTAPPAPDVVRLFGPAYREGGTAFVPSFSIPPLRAAWRLPVEWRKGRPLLLVRDGGVTRRFLLDTGAVVSFVRPTGVSRKFRVGPLRVVAGDYDAKLFDLLSDVVGVTVDGLVGTDALAEFRLLIDPAAEEVHACPADVPLSELRASFFGHRSWRFGRATVSLPWSPTATALLDRPLPLRPLSDAVREETAIPFPKRLNEFQWAMTVAIGGRPHPLIPDWWADQTTVGPRVRVERTGRLQQTLLTEASWNMRRLARRAYGSVLSRSGRFLFSSIRAWKRA